MWLFRLTILVLVVVGVGVAQADPPVEEPTDPSAQTDVTDPTEDGDDALAELDAEQVAAELQRLTTAIEDVETQAQADELFSEASRFDRDDPGVNQAYLKRMLQFGQVQKAVYAARRLLKFSDREGIAFAVLAYYEADQGYLAKAFPEAVLAAELLPLDPGVMHNAGALVAWYEFQEDVSYVPEEVRQALLLNGAIWGEHPDFAAAYANVNAIMSAYESRLVEIDDLLIEIEASMDAVEAKIEVMVERLYPIDRELRALRHDLYAAKQRLAGQYWTTAQLKARIRAANDRISVLAGRADLTPSQLEELARLEERVRFWQRDLSWSYDPRSERQIRERIFQLRDEIRDVQRERDEVITEIRIEQRRLAALKDDRREADKQLDDIERLKQKALGIRDKRASWQLPMVNGEQIDLAAIQAQSRARNVSRPPAKPGEFDAGKSLQMARQYASGGRKDLAIELLEKILAEAPDSGEAVEAEELLNELTRPSPTN
jgi:predicted  nucleic acid-binding Zn-ribbon protein